MSDRQKFKAVNSGMSLEEINTKIRKRRVKILRRVLIAVTILTVIVVAVNIGNAMRSYSSYDIRSVVKRTGSEASKFIGFKGKIIEYSNDGARYWGTGRESIWNRSFEMNTPVTAICKDYIIVFDKGGSQICILTEQGMKKKIETSHPIKKACVAEQGTVAVLMEESGTSYVKLYDKEGTELANGQFYGDQGGYPTDIALSYDAKKLAVALADVTGGSVKSMVTFYNFGSVGQNEIDNNVGSYTFDGLFIPQISYVSDNRMVAIGDKEFIVFDGKEKPSMTREVKLEKNITSIFCNESRIGVTRQNADSSKPYHIHVYDMKGNTVMENDTTLQYDAIEFMDNGEICVRNSDSLEFFTEQGICKYTGQFDHRFCYAQPIRGQREYIFVFEDTIEEVRLK